YPIRLAFVGLTHLAYWASELSYWGKRFGLCTDGLPVFFRSPHQILPINGCIIGGRYAIWKLCLVYVSECKRRNFMGRSLVRIRYRTDFGVSVATNRL